MEPLQRRVDHGQQVQHDLLERPVVGAHVHLAGAVHDADGALVRGPISQPATEPVYLDVAIVLALVGFLGAVAFARFIGQGTGR